MKYRLKVKTMGCSVLTKWIGHCIFVNLFTISLC